MDDDIIGYLRCYICNKTTEVYEYESNESFKEIVFKRGWGFIKVDKDILVICDGHKRVY